MQPAGDVDEGVGDMGGQSDGGDDMSKLLQVRQSLSPNGRVTVDEEVERIGLGRFHYVAAAVCGLGNASDAVELLAIGYIIPSLDVSDNEKAVLTAAVFVGMLVGGMICGLLSDRIGRKPCLLFSLGCNSVFALGSAASPSWGWLVLCRVMSGVGVGGSVPSVFTLFAEYLPVHRRGGMLTAVAWFWMVGSILTAGMAWVVLGAFGLSWRVFAALSAIPSGLACILSLLLLPESPRFYASKANIKGAQKVLRTMARRCGVPPCEKVPELSRHDSMKPEPFSKLFHPSIRWTTVLLCIVWFALSFGWYGLILWIPTLFKDVNFSLSPYEDSFMVAAANLPGNIVATLIMDSVGRKRVLGYSMTISAAFAILFAFSTTAWMTVGTACILNAVSIAGWNALDCLSAESFPTTLRASGMGLLSGCGRIGSIAGQFVFGALISVSVHLLLGVAATMLLVGSASAFLLPKEPSNAQMAARVEDDDTFGGSKLHAELSSSEI